MEKPGQVVGLLLFQCSPGLAAPLRTRFDCCASIFQLHSKGYDKKMGAFDAINTRPQKPLRTFQAITVLV
jgi:hypothetical protein